MVGTMHSSRRPNLTPHHGATSDGLADSFAQFSFAPPTPAASTPCGPTPASAAYGATPPRYAAAHDKSYAEAYSLASDGTAHIHQHSGGSMASAMRHVEQASGQAEIDHANRRRRLHRQLTERSQALRRSPQELWAQLRPTGGVVTISNLSDGLGRLGLRLAEVLCGGDPTPRRHESHTRRAHGRSTWLMLRLPCRSQVDFNELVELLATSDSRTGERVVLWQNWQHFLSASQPGWEDSAAERKRRLTLQRVLQSLGGDRSAAALVRWFQARDRQRSGRVTFAEFCAGLRANGVILSEVHAGPRTAALAPGPVASPCPHQSTSPRTSSIVQADAQLAAVEMDPLGGGTSVAYGSLARLLNEGSTRMPMPS